jgi:hypothetical protein
LRKDFCIFILSHGRPNHIYTIDTILNMGYSGEWFIVIDNEDKTANEYYEKYGTEKVLMFDKDEVYKKHDRGDNFINRKCIFSARNVCFDLAEELKYKYFMELDDDYTSVGYRFDQDLNYKGKRITEPIFDFIIDQMIKFLECNEKILTVTFAQTGDFMAKEIRANIRLKRKAMNSFVCSTKKRFNFVGNINEDVNTYTKLGQEGYLFIMLNHIALQQKQTQKQEGGMTDIYLDSGTYVKSFYTVMYCPSCTKITILKCNDRPGRIHHKILWKNAVPCILNEKFKKS